MADSTKIINSSKEPGLYIVSTPIGNLRDITYRAVETLKMADLVLCEDTRETGKLLAAYNIKAKLESYNDHNAGAKRPQIISALQNGAAIALVSDAGTPLVSDPGYKIVQDAIKANIKIHPVPGASSSLAALVMSGMPSDVFTFCGFVDSKKFDKFAVYDSTLIFFESAKRLSATLQQMRMPFNNRTVAVCREITKIYEELKSGSFDEVASYYQAHPPKGEIVILLSPPSLAEFDFRSITTELATLLKTKKLKEAAEILGVKYNISKKKIYEIGLTLKD